MVVVVVVCVCVCVCVCGGGSSNYSTHAFHNFVFFGGGIIWLFYTRIPQFCFGGVNIIIMVMVVVCVCVVVVVVVMVVVEGGGVI